MLSAHVMLSFRGRPFFLMLVLGMFRQVSPAAGSRLRGSENCQGTAVTAGVDFEQVDQAANRLLVRGNFLVVASSSCSTTRWCLKKQKSMVGVSKCRMRANLSYVTLADCSSKRRGNSPCLV